MEAFQTTRWSLISAARGDATQARLALEQLCRAYRPPVLAFIRHHGRDAGEAEDLAQAFFLQFIEQGWYAGADPLRGRFRGLLLTALRRFLLDQRDLARAGKRGGTRLVAGGDALERIPDEAASPERFFARAWMANVLARAADRLQEEWERKGKGDQYRQLEALLMERADANEVRAIAERSGLRANTLTVQAHRMRQRLRELVRLEVMQTVGSAEALEAELAELRGALESGGVPATAHPEVVDAG